MRQAARISHARPPLTDRHEPSDDAHVGDAELAERSRVDAQAFGVLYARYWDQTYRIVHRRLREHAVAEDVTAEVFVKAFRAIDGYRPARAPFWAWLYRITQNAVVDHLRSSWPVLPLPEAAEQLEARVDVEAEVLRRIEADRAWHAVSRLCQPQRAAMTMRLGYDLPIAVIAARMNRSEGAVKQLINRGRTTVRDLLAE